MTTHPWAHLPNAAHIDAVLADVKARPEVWAAARDAAWDAAWVAAWVAARRAARRAVSDAAWDAAWVAARGTARGTAWDAVRVAVRDTALALIAWDSSAALLNQPPDVLRTMIDLADAPVCHQAALLLPWAIAKFNN